MNIGSIIPFLALMSINILQHNPTIPARKKNKAKMITFTDTEFKSTQPITIKKLLVGNPIIGIPQV